MLRINREIYLNQLVNKQNNGLVKIITGIRRCGKSFLLDPIFKEYLISEGVSENHIIKIDLDERRNNKYQDPDVLDEYIREVNKHWTNNIKNEEKGLSINREM